MDEKLMNALVVDELRACFKVFGIEYTEEVFRKALANSPKTLKIFQENYNKLLKGEA